MFVAITSRVQDGLLHRAQGTNSYPEVEKLLSSFAPKTRLEALAELQRLGWVLLTTASYVTDEGTFLIDTLSLDELPEENDDLVTLRTKLSTDVPFSL